MGWKHDPQLLQQHVTEARRFWDMARGDEPAGWGDLVGRPFAPNAPGPGYPVAPQPVQPAPVNIYLVQAQQMLEANIITQQTYQNIVNTVYGQ